MNCFEGYATFLDIGRDRVDDGVGPAKSGGNRGWVAHIGPEDGNIMQAGGPEDTASLVGMSNRDAHRRPVTVRQTFEQFASRGNPVPPKMTTVAMPFLPHWGNEALIVLT